MNLFLIFVAAIIIGNVVYAVIRKAVCHESHASFCEVEPMLEKMNTVAFDFDGVAKYDGLNLAVRNQIP